MRKKILLNIIFISFSCFLKSQTWSPVGTGTIINSPISALYNDTINDLLYVGCYNTPLIAKWDGTNWNTVGFYGLFPTVVRCITEYQGDIYAGGEFNWADGITVSNIARWNGVYWDSLQGGVDNRVISMVVFNNELYVAGNFNNANGNPVSKIAKWDGNNWSSVGYGFNGGINVLKIYNGELFAGGDFTTAGGQPAYYIAKWDGNSWSAVGSGLSTPVYSMVIYNNKLYMSYGSNTAIWDETYLTAWNNGGEMDNNILCMLVLNNDLYYGGHFIVAGGDTVNRIAKLNQQGWSPLGSGMNDGVFSMAIYKNELYAGGWFTMSGNDSVNYIAKYNLPVQSVENSISQKETFYIFPNPISKSELLYIHYANPDFVYFDIYNSIGKSVKSLVNNYIINNSSEISVSVKNLPVGIYFVGYSKTFVVNFGKNKLKIWILLIF